MADMSSMTDGGSILEQFMEMSRRLGISISSEQQELLLMHLALVLEKNTQLNLTSIKGMQDGIILHIEDSLVAAIEMAQAPEGPFCDIGTGGGFPGIPLGIVSNRDGVLIDSVKKKAHAVQGFIEKLGLAEKLSAEGIRAEELAIAKGNHFSIVISRALSSLPAILELSAPLLKSGGHAIALKGKLTEEEYAYGKETAEIVGLRQVSDRTLTIGDGFATRRVLAFEKIGEPQVKLPRKIGLAQKRPLRKKT